MKPEKYETEPACKKRIFKKMEKYNEILTFIGHIHMKLKRFYKTFQS